MVKINVKSGLEIHQQLDTGKLFCRCPSILRKDEPDWVVNRKLHAVAGEKGGVDISAQFEAFKNKDFIYQGYKDTNCLLEFDEEPPMEINVDALDIAIKITLLLNCEIIPISQIMRKTVIDGSNTSGFQRTVLIGRKGSIETSKGRVGIQTVYLEEDAARIVNKNDDKIIFRLDRLGIPLIEIATDPDLKDGEMIKEAALKIGSILRSVGVKRGLGTIRQDINISVGRHPRVEIKGFQDAKMFIKVVQKEVERQEKIGANGKKEVRKANEDGTTSFLRPLPGSARMYPETDLPLLRISKAQIDKAKKNLPKIIDLSVVEKELRGKGLSEEMINQLLNAGEIKIKEFEVLENIYGNPNFIAKVILIYPKEIASKNNIKNIENKLHMDVIETIIEKVKHGKIGEGDVKGIMEKVSKGKSIYDALKVEKTDSRHLEAEIAKIVKEKPGLSIGAYMGLVMKGHKGKVDGKQASEILKKLL